MSKIFYLVTEEALFDDLQGYSSLFEGSDDFTYMLDEFLDLVRVYHRVFKVYQTRFPISYG